MSKKIITMSIIFCFLMMSLAAYSSSENLTQAATQPASSTPRTYSLVETGQGTCYDDSGEKISCPAEGKAFYGQDAQFASAAFNFTDNGDGTVTDHVTGLIWQQTPPNSKYSWKDAQSYCDLLSLAGSDNWRTPSLKELFSISDFEAGWPYIDTDYFRTYTTYGQDKVEQYWSNNYYRVGTDKAVKNSAFGVNHATGHIKAYPDGSDISPMAGKCVRCVQGEDYLINDFVDNGDGTVSDRATGLMWMKDDSGKGLDWESALAYADNLSYAGYDDWRLPNVKELQSIVDYSGVYPAIDQSYFNITDEDAYFWSSTSAYFNPATPGHYYAWYVAFGYAVGEDGKDSHGAGAVRFDGKGEDGPTGEDQERIFNYVRLVRGGYVTETPDGNPTANDSVKFVEPTSNSPNGQGGPTGASGTGQGPMGPLQDGSVSSPGAGANAAVSTDVAKIPYPVIDTGQGACFNTTNQITCPQQAGDFFGQDAQYTATKSAYQLSSDGLTVNDKNTGLTWQRSPDTNGDGSITMGDKLTWTQAQAYPATLNAEKYGGYSDWRMPTIKELYSLMDFRGTDPSGFTGTDTSGLTPFIDTDYFSFAYGQTSAGERIIDSQYASSNLYNGKLLFGVNFADGRIKGYGLTLRNSDKTFFVTCVRGNPDYGINSFMVNGDGTITDKATGLMWSQSDSSTGMNWQDALLWVQQKNKENFLGHNDWRLPNAKELQSIVDYSRSPDTTGSAAINLLFSSTQITNEAGQADYPFYWTGTTHASSNGMGAGAVYIAFGRAMGYMDGQWQDVHGAGAQRSDPKTGNASDFKQGNGPQGDAVRIDNYVRLVRG